MLFFTFTYNFNKKQLYIYTNDKNRLICRLTKINIYMKLKVFINYYKVQLNIFVLF